MYKEILINEIIAGLNELGHIVTDRTVKELRKKGVSELTEVAQLIYSSTIVRAGTVNLCNMKRLEKELNKTYRDSEYEE